MTLSQLVSFLAFQIRVIAGLRALAKNIALRDADASSMAALGFGRLSLVLPPHRPDARIKHHMTTTIAHPDNVEPAISPRTISVGCLGSNRFPPNN